MINLSRVDDLFKFQGLNQTLLVNTEHRENIPVSEVVTVIDKYRGIKDLTMFCQNCIAEANTCTEAESRDILVEGAIRSYRIISANFHVPELFSELESIIKRSKSSDAFFGLVVRGYFDTSVTSPETSIDTATVEKTKTVQRAKKRTLFSADLESDSSDSAPLKKRLRSSENRQSVPTEKIHSISNENRDTIAIHKKESHSHSGRQSCQIVVLIPYMRFLKKRFGSYVAETNWSSVSNEVSNPIARNRLKRTALHAIICSKVPVEERLEIKDFIDTMTKTRDYTANTFCEYCKPSMAQTDQTKD